MDRSQEAESLEVRARAIQAKSACLEIPVANLGDNPNSAPEHRGLCSIGFSKCGNFPLPS
jgi:hypothetical protein